MHTIIVIAAGIIILVSGLFLGNIYDGGSSGMILAAKIFIPLWFGLAFVNMYFGVQRGYSWAEEFPIFLGIFLLPAIISVVIIWKLSQ
ncbi:hypothetical protein ACO0K7_00810 [Undibacterium sp. Ji67W]|uniref:hypothetical protein n=1 Tax=Undibacterium sp. Ji67W TaxID=3413042 RepID=UPI003BF28D65